MGKKAGATGFMALDGKRKRAVESSPKGRFEAGWHSRSGTAL